MRQYGALIHIGMAVNDYYILCVDAYVSCECVTEDDTPLFKISLCKGVGAFPKRNIYIIRLVV